MPKGFIHLILIFAICLTGCAASNLNSSTSATSTSSALNQPPSATTTILASSTSTMPTISYNDPAISRINQISPYSSPTETMTLNAESAGALISLWRDFKWGQGTTKTAYDYVFECDSSIIQYSSQYGIFNDIQNDRNLRITEEQRIAINFMLFNSFFADRKVNAITPPGCSQCIVELTAGGYYYSYPNTSYAVNISFSRKTRESYEQLKYKWEHEEEYYSYHLEKAYDADRDEIVYRYTRGNGDSMMLVVYSFQTEDYTYTVYEEYVLDESESIPYSVNFLGTNSTQYFLVQINNPAEPITKEWISMWRIQSVDKAND